MFKYAKKIADKIEAEFIVTGEVLNQRPFSQRRDIMLMIEREAGLEGRVLRPLSAKLLPETEVEKNDLVDRKKLFEIKGRRRLPQMHLVKKLGITDYPCPSGGCLLTDPRFADRLRDFLKHNPKPTLKTMTLLKLGRHFRIEGNKVIVGRNEEENRTLLFIAKREGIPYLNVIEYVGPTTLLIGNEDNGIVEKTASITVRYSDAPKEVEVDVKYSAKIMRTVTTQAIEDQEIEQWRV
jgi:tRNA U34 2-thiouridine synthase MnmA/TrmU